MWIVMKGNGYDRKSLAHRERTIQGLHNKLKKLIDEYDETGKSDLLVKIQKASIDIYKSYKKLYLEASYVLIDENCEPKQAKMIKDNIKLANTN